MTATPGWRSALQSYLQGEARPPHKYGHQPRLYRLASQIAASAGLHPDDDVLFASAFLHDLGVFVGHRPEDPRALQQWDHVAYVCDRAPDLLAGMGFPTQKIPSVLAAIREHQPQNEPTSLEATLLRDADILEQLGAIGILRTGSKIGSDTRFGFFDDARRSLRHALDTFPAQLRLPTARLLAQPRISTLRSFLEALDAEAGQHLG